MILQNKVADVTTVILVNGGKMVEIQNLLLYLGLGGGWSVCSPEWRKILGNQKNAIITTLLKARL